MTTHIPRKGPLGQPTTNGGHFAAQTNTAAPEGLLAKRSLYAREQDSVAKQAKENAAKAELANFCSDVIANWDGAASVRISTDDDDPELIWAKILDQYGEEITDEPADGGYDATTRINSWNIEGIEMFAGDTHDLEEIANWDPTAVADLCDRCGGEWGADTTCQDCCDDDGKPRVR